MRKLLITTLSALIFISCQKDREYSNFPFIKLEENENKQFTFTNKKSGFFLGNSHEYNSSGHDGWTVNEFHYLKDYKMFLKNEELKRDSLIEFIYYPFSAFRKYPNQTNEKFTLLDSVDVLLLEIEGDNIAMNLEFEPILHYSVTGKQIRLTQNNSLLIFSPQELAGLNPNNNINFLGIDFKSISDDKVQIIAALAKTENELRNLISKISEDTDSYKQKRIQRFDNLINLNRLQTNNPDITDAVTWAQISLDALVTEQRGKGIWAGLPWFNNYWGRDTFISFCGALLVNGKFDEAREILRSFSKFQLSDENDKWYGRIPNRVTNQEIIYNTADGTWWFIREVYEYLLYTGDMDFAKEIYPVVKNAIEGALKHRIDINHFLMHDDADTWMDAKKEGVAWSPRGNRAVEIQALWYTALQIGSFLAKQNNENDYGQKWTTVSNNLQENFIKYFWNSYKFYLYDHLYPDGNKDKKIRPNQIFAVTVPDLPGIKPLLPENMQQKVVNDVLRKLTYYFGVASLSQQDEDFHPWHHYAPFYVQDEAYHNGIVWTWLAGPVISGLTKFNREQIAYELFAHEAYQILHWDAIGNFSELLDALPRPGKGEPQISGTVSQAWSLAEFVRNFYQDVVGFQPIATENKIIFYPHIPQEISLISTNLKYKKSNIRFFYHKTDEWFNIEIIAENLKKSVECVLHFPGYEPEYFTLEKSNSVFKIGFPQDERSSYIAEDNLDWHFLQGELNETLSALKEPDHPIVHSADIYFPEINKMNPIISGKDNLNDDTGPNGKYVYPLSPNFPAGIFDIESFSLYELENEWGFVLKMKNLFNPNWHPEYGFQLSFLAIAFQDSRQKSGIFKIGKNANYSLSSARAAHDILYVGGGFQLIDKTGKIKLAFIPDDLTKPFGFTNTREIRFRIKKSYLPYLKSDCKITILAGGQDDHGGAGIGDFRDVRIEAGEWHGGGAASDNNASRIYDILEIN